MNTLKFGQHFPNGKDAVDFAYDIARGGTWKTNFSLNYEKNYYGSDKFPWLPSNHAYDRNTVLTEANGSKNLTCLDANGHLLGDPNKSGEVLNKQITGAFFEHHGVGSNGVKGGQLSLFWYDDNVLATAMARAYGKELPDTTALKPYNNFSRWSIMNGDIEYWTPYTGTYLDQLALNGIYYGLIDDLTNATNCWNTIKNNVSTIYDSSTQQFNYTIPENYYTGLFLILTSFLYELETTANVKKEYYQHLVSLRSKLLSSQITDSQGGLIGWTTSNPSSLSFLNTETSSCCSLGLAAGASQVYEATKSPMGIFNGGFYIRPYNVLSAVKSNSQSGMMSYGPYINLKTGESYEVEFCLRAPVPVNELATLQIYNTTENAVMYSKTLNAQDFATENQWTAVKFSFQFVGKANDQIEFRTVWNGQENLDLAFIRVL